MTPEEYRVDRDQLISEWTSATLGDNLLRAQWWHEGRKIAYILITVTDPSERLIARLDCDHGTVHTHFMGHEATEEVRKEHATIPADPLTGMDYLTQTFPQWWTLMAKVAEGSKP